MKKYKQAYKKLLRELKDREKEKRRIQRDERQKDEAKRVGWNSVAKRMKSFESS